MSGLKRCPFCDEMPWHSVWGEDDHVLFCPSKDHKLYVTSFGSMKSAIDKWNNRPIEDELRKRIAELEAELAKYRWISVSERLPTENTLYVMLVESRADLNKFTHWMPLPEPPEVKK